MLCYQLVCIFFKKNLNSLQTSNPHYRRCVKIRFRIILSDCLSKPVRIKQSNNKFKAYFLSDPINSLHSFHRFDTFSDYQKRSRLMSLNTSWSGGTLMGRMTGLIIGQHLRAVKLKCSEGCGHISGLAAWLYIRKVRALKK